MKQTVRHYHMDMDGKAVSTGCVLLGIALFLRAVYYFGFSRTESVGFGTLLLGLILPLLLELALIVLLRGVKLDAAGLYGIIGAAYCVLLMVQCFQYGNVFRTVLGIIAYVLCGGLCFCAVAGLLSKEISVAAFFLTAVIRFLFVLKPYILGLHLIAFLPEAAGLCAVCALGYLVLGLKPVKKSNKKTGSS